jgi:hypothetical protein
LAVGGTLWRVPDVTTDLYDLPGKVFSRPHDVQRATDNHWPLAIGDSKQLFNSGGSLEKLELPLLAVLANLGIRPSRAPQLVSLLAEIAQDQLLAEPGYDWSSLLIPVATTGTDIDHSAQRLKTQFEDSGARAVELAATVVFPNHWNEGLEEFGNKASLLSVLSCRLVNRLLKKLSHDDPGGCLPVRIYCDKHGGRNHYAAMIQKEISENFVTVHYESRETSQYSWSDDSGRPVEMNFSARGEQQLPVALASMIAKYLRELSMMAWNRFWQQRLPELQPTAGYPQDARRFRQDIAGEQKKLRIQNAAIWRTR